MTDKRTLQRQPPTAVVHADAAAQHGQDAADLRQLAVLLCVG